MTLKLIDRLMNFQLTHPPTLFSSESIRFSGWRAILGARRADPPHPVQKAVSHDPQIKECKQREELLVVFRQAPITCLQMAKLTLDYSKRMVDFGTDTRLGAFEIIEHLTQRRGRIHCPSLAWPHRYVPSGLDRLRIVALVHTHITGIAKRVCFLAMHQGMLLRDIVHIRHCLHHRVDQSRVGIGTDVDLHPEVPLVAFLDLVHLRITLPALILRRGKRSDQGGVDHGAFPQYQTRLGQVGIEDLQELLGQPVFFQQMPKAQDAHPIRQPAYTTQTRKLTAHRDIEQRFFHGQIRHVEPSLEEVNTQHGLKRKGRSAGTFPWRERRDQCQERRPRYRACHGFEKFALASATLRQIKPWCELFR